MPAPVWRLLPDNPLSVGQCGVQDLRSDIYYLPCRQCRHLLSPLQTVQGGTARGERANAASWPSPGIDTAHRAPTRLHPGPLPVCTPGLYPSTHTERPPVCTPGLYPSAHRASTRLHTGPLPVYTPGLYPSTHTERSPVYTQHHRSTGCLGTGTVMIPPSLAPGAF